MATWIAHLRIAENLLAHIPDLDAAQFAINQTDRGVALTLAPAASTVHLSEIRPDPDTRAARDGFNLFDGADDFEPHS